MWFALPDGTPLLDDVSYGAGGRTGKRAVVCQNFEPTGLMRRFDAEIWFGERVAVLGANGSGKSHFMRLLAAGGTDPEREPTRHRGRNRLRDP